MGFLGLHIPWLRWLDFDVVWPLLLIVGGGALIWRRLKGKDGEQASQNEGVSASPEKTPANRSEESE